jgi:hypothetical protein
MAEPPRTVLPEIGSKSQLSSIVESPLITSGAVTANIGYFIGATIGVQWVIGDTGAGKIFSATAAARVKAY